MDCPPLVSKYSTPKILWYQTDETVVIRILLADVTDYFLKVEVDHLRFSTIVEGKGYYVCLNLFGAVIAKRTTHRNVGREIQIRLDKGHKGIDWLRLQTEKERNPLIAVDPDHVDSANRSIDSLPGGLTGSFEEYKRRYNVTQIMPPMSSTDEEESDGEGVDLMD